MESKLKRLTQNPEAIEAANKLGEKKGRLVEKRNNIKKRLHEIESEVKQLEQKLQYQKERETNQEKTVQKAEKGRSLVALATYRKTGEEIRKKAADEMRGRISSKVGELWIDITDRGREFLRMYFDESWNCFLDRRPADDRMPWDQVVPSAGQRQVQLVFYEVLRQLAQRVPPMVVDTPLGRLDKEVREAVLNTIYLRGHQSVILATNAEMDPDGPLFQSVKDQLARVYTLETHGDQNNPHYEVRVVNNYFGENL